LSRRCVAADMEPPSGFNLCDDIAISTGRFVAFAPHVTRGFCKGNAFGVINTVYLNY
jgi:hypothetical protein